MKLMYLSTSSGMWSETKSDGFSVFASACGTVLIGICWDHLGYQTRLVTTYFYDTKTGRVTRVRAEQRRSVYIASGGCGIWFLAKPCGPRSVRHDDLGYSGLAIDRSLRRFDSADKARQYVPSPYMGYGHDPRPNISSNW